MGNFIENKKNLWVVIDSCTQIMVVNQVRLPHNESGVFLLSRIDGPFSFFLI